MNGFTDGSWVLEEILLFLLFMATTICVCSAVGEYSLGAALINLHSRLT